MKDNWLYKKPKKLLTKTMTAEGKRDDSIDDLPIVVSIELKPDEEHKRSQLMSVDEDIFSDVVIEDIGVEGPGPD